MIANTLSVMWKAFAPALGNHLWQSTLFAIAAGLLTLILRKNHARSRYWLWLAASMKFLIPFSLLFGLASRLAWSRGPAGTNAGLYITMEEVSQPFTQPTVSMIPQSAASAVLIHLLPGILAAAWLCGFLAVVFAWYLRWRRVSNSLRNAEPLREGREVEMLRRLERVGGRRKRIEMFLSRTSLEPGIFGISRPALIWPQGISEYLEDGHLEAILAHEVWHVRRRDNLAAALHMLVQAVCWFHPLVWWLGARLVEERERACDEAVLASGSNRHVYAESILKICEFCVGSPLSCVSAVTGADLKKRITRIMSESIGHKLDSGRKLLLSAAAFLAVATPVTLGLLHSTPTRAASPIIQSTLDQTLPFDWQNTAGGKQSFTFASVKHNTSGRESSSMNVPIGPGDEYLPNGGVFTATNVPLVSYIYFAYKLTGGQLQLLIPHLPQWVLKDRYDVEARASGNVTKDQMRLMMQSLLEDRFKLAIHYETQQLPVFALVLENPGKTGPRLQLHMDDPACSAAPSPTTHASAEATPATVAGGFPVACGGIIGMPSTPLGRLRAGARNVPIQLLATTLPQIGNLDRVVVDQTGLSGTFDFVFEWTPQINRPLPSGVNAPMGEPGPDFLEDLEQQLGLKLNQQAAPVEILVIDHAEQPSEN
jgi:bla regulator protein BlaR1